MSRQDNLLKRYERKISCLKEDGTVNGKWEHCEKTLSAVDGGHGMIFKDFDGKLRFTMHYPNGPWGAERAKIMEIEEISNEPYLAIK